MERDICPAGEPDQGRVLDSRSDSTHPLVVGRTKTLDRAALTGSEKPQFVDPIAFISESRMIAGE